MSELREYLMLFVRNAHEDGMSTKDILTVLGEVISYIVEYWL